MGNVTLRSYQHFIKPRSRLALNAAIPILLAIATFLAYPSAAHAQLKVIISGGFSTAYRQVLPEFEGSTGITVTTLSGASQGKGPETIAAQLSRGVAADVAILSREGLSELIAAGRIAAGTDIDLARAALGAAVRSGTRKPDISSVAAFKQALLSAKVVAVPASTSGIYLTSDLFPRLGIADKLNTRIMPRAGSKEVEASGRLIAFLASERAAACSLVFFFYPARGVRIPWDALVLSSKRTGTKPESGTRSPSGGSSRRPKVPERIPIRKTIFSTYSKEP